MHNTVLISSLHLVVTPRLSSPQAGGQYQYGTFRWLDTPRQQTPSAQDARWSVGELIGAIKPIMYVLYTKLGASANQCLSNKRDRGCRARRQKPWFRPEGIWARKLLSQLFKQLFSY